MKRFWDRINLFILCINYMLVMGVLSVVIFGATSQKYSAPISVVYNRPTYTILFDANGGSCSTSSKSVKFGDNYGTLPTPTKAKNNFKGWKLGSQNISSTTQNTTAKNHTLVAEWEPWVSYISKDWGSRIGTSIVENATSIAFTKDQSKISGLTNSVSVGTINETSTSAFVETQGVQDVRAYWGSDKKKIVIFSPGTIYAPKNCYEFFCHCNIYEGESMEFTSIDLSNFDTSKTANMRMMFMACHLVEELDLGGFNCVNVKGTLQSDGIAYQDISLFEDSGSSYGTYLLRKITLPYNIDTAHHPDFTWLYLGFNLPGTFTDGTNDYTIIDGTNCSTETNKITLVRKRKV